MTESPFDPTEPASGFVWMNHDGGVPAPIAEGAVEAWTMRGWAVCDPPADIDPTRVEQPAVEAATTPPAARRRPTRDRGMTHA